MTSPWARPETAVAAGLDPFSVTERSARRRVGDAGPGRVVVVPVYVRRSRGPGRDPVQAGVVVRLSTGGGISVDRDLTAHILGDPAVFWRALDDAAADPASVAERAGWTRVVVTRLADGGPQRSLVLLDTDWQLLRSALALRHGRGSGPQDAEVPRAGARFLGRLDGLDATASTGLWGRLALEVVSVRHPGRLADTISLRWHASWGVGGFPAGSGGRADGSAGSSMLLDLRQQRAEILGRPFRVRTLPDWEREQAAADLGLSPRRLLAWSVVPLSTVLACFDEVAPAPAPSVSDAVYPPSHGAGPQDAPRHPTPRDAS